MVCPLRCGGVQVAAAVDQAKSANWLPAAPVTGTSTGGANASGAATWVESAMSYLGEAVELAGRALPRESVASIARGAARALAAAVVTRLLAAPDAVKAWNLYAIERLAVGARRPRRGCSDARGGGGGPVCHRRRWAGAWKG